MRVAHNAGGYRLPVLLRTVPLMFAVAAAGACDSPTEPDLPPPMVEGYRTSCTGDGFVPLSCVITVACSRPCTSAQTGDAADATSRASWEVEGIAIRHVGSGRFEAVSAGNASIWAHAGAIRSVAVPVTSFAGMQPVRTAEIGGRVLSAATNAPINDAVLTVVSGPASGWSIRSGSPPPPIPGFTTFFYRPDGGGYLLQGLPPGNWLVDVTASGFRPQTFSAEIADGLSRQQNIVLTPE